MLSSVLDLSGDIINLVIMLLNQAGVDVSALSSK
ncbi:hypothetical protein ACUXA5_001806 [Corynebacterium hesseae]